MFKNINIKIKLFLLTSIPTLAFLTLSLDIIYTNKSKIDNTNKIVSLMQVTSDASTLVFNLQRERGLSIGYIKGKSQKSQQLLLIQQKQSDKSLKIFKINSNIDNNILKQLDKIILIRDKISLLKLTAQESFSYYTNLIEKLLFLQNSIILISQDKHLLQLTQMNMHLLSVIENAGQERAVLNNIFLSKELTIKKFQEFSILNIKQEEHLKYYKKFTKKSDNDMFSNSKDYSYFTNTIVLNSNQRKIEQNSFKWWEISTKRIDELIELSLTDQKEIRLYIEKNQNDLYYKFLFIIFLSIIILTVMTFWFKSIITNFIFSLDSLAKGIENFILFVIYKEIKVKPIDIISNDEIGLISKNINTNIKLLEACLKCDEVVLEEVSEAVKNAKNNIHMVSEIKCFADNTQLENMKFDFNEMIEILKTKTHDLNIAKKEIESSHKNTRDSIAYAALIQNAVISQDQDMKYFFKDSFVYWMPKDTVGGDIWLFNQLRHEDECLLFFIDCTGHGVPGAFVTMIVKAIEREIVSKILKDTDMDISPAWIMSYFNKTMKILLKQETKDSLSNAGWDGGIIYYNKQTQILKFAGAETPLFYLDLDGSYNTIKGNRYSVGYKKCAMNYQYKESILKVKEGMKFYCTTDGYLDQNGGEKDFPFGKKRFGNIIKEHNKKSMSDKKNILIKEISKYENMIVDTDRNDDITVIGFEIGAKSSNKLVSNILHYNGELTQGIIAHSMETIENKINDLSTMTKVAIILVELLQNMMKYSKSSKNEQNKIIPTGKIDIVKDDYNTYYINSKNIINIEDKQKIENKLIKIKSLNTQELRKEYRELRRLEKHTDKNNRGIGFYEIAKLATNFKYIFVPINDKKFYFEYKAIIENK